MKRVNQSGRKTVNGVALTAIAAAVASVLAVPAQAATYNVTNVAGLKAAISAANASPEADTIHLAAQTFNIGTSDLVGGEADTAFPVAGELTVEGEGIGNTVLIRDAAASQFRFFHVDAEAKLTLRNLEVSGGALSHDETNDTFGKSRRGGAVKNEGELVVESVKFTANSAALGGAIAGMPGSSMTVSDSIFEGNFTTKRTQGDGGAIFNDAGTARIQRSTFTNNYTQFNNDITDTISDGGAIENSIGFMEVLDSTFIGNSSYCGGAIENAMGRLIIKNSTFSGNTGMLHAGAVYGSEPRLKSDESQFGAGLIEIYNSTMSGNHAGYEGGGGMFVDAGIATLKNSIIADNDYAPKPGVETGGPDLGYKDRLGNDYAQFKQDGNYPGMILVAGTNLIGDLTNVDVRVLEGTQALVIYGADIADLGSLADNGTPGNAHFPLQATSLAIGQGGDCEPKDQLGNARPGNCDLGAVEDQDTAAASFGDQYKKTVIGDYEIPAFYTASASSDDGSSGDSNNTSPAVVESAGASGANSESAGGGGSLDLLGLALLGLPLLRKFRKKS